MELSKRQKRLLAFVKEQHGQQKRKYTGDPYWTHVYSVAERVSQLVPEGIEIALGHDLLEDTSCTYELLKSFLSKNGYTASEATQIADGVVELTDVFVKEDYPELNRKTRKEKEADRLSRISPLAQSVKYADLIDNNLSIVEHSSSFAKTYLMEKVDILDGMRLGNIHLLIHACAVLNNGLKELGLESWQGNSAG
ncbi:MAG: metal-dependent phosphohydrolase [Roseivirga sp.]|nr:metal-dependent phosphohydrolase [Roseivirga sp.]